MIILVHLGDQIDAGHDQFAFYNTIDRLLKKAVAARVRLEQVEGR